jgi:hypothetical protein
LPSGPFGKLVEVGTVRRGSRGSPVVGVSGFGVGGCGTTGGSSFAGGCPGPPISGGMRSDSAGSSESETVSGPSSPNRSHRRVM